MARSQGKRNVHRAQPARHFVKATSTATTSAATGSDNPDPIWARQQHKISGLPQVRGKTLKSLEFISAPEYKGISLSFRDNTFLDLKIETAFTVKADYLNQKTGKHRSLKRWP